MDSSAEYLVWMSSVKFSSFSTNEQINSPARSSEKCLAPLRITVCHRGYSDSNSISQSGPRGIFRKSSGSLQPVRFCNYLLIIHQKICPTAIPSAKLSKLVLTPNSLCLGRYPRGHDRVTIGAAAMDSGIRIPTVNGQKHAKLASLTLFALHIDKAAVAPDNPQNGR